MLRSAPVTVVMPVYEDRESARLLLRELADVLPVRPYIVVVEDGSVREPLQINDITDAGLSGEVLYLIRNMGHQRAIAVGVFLRRVPSRDGRTGGDGFGWRGHAKRDPGPVGAAAAG